jgi:hypothetical protein
VFQIIDLVRHMVILLLSKQVTTLAEECRHRSLKVQLYKRKLEETWLIARDEATKCNAAKEIIKILTNQV